MLVFLLLLKMLIKNTMLPPYLIKKLESINLLPSKINVLGPFKTFGILKAHFPSLNFYALKILFEYYQTINHNNTKYDIKKIVKIYNKLPPIHTQIDISIMQQFLDDAYDQAQIAAQEQEIPIGCVVVNNNEVIARAYNKTQQNCDIMAHAEILAIELATKMIGNYRLKNCDLYTTLEPCVMCAGAIIESRIKRLIFGCYRKENIGAISRGLLNEKKFNPHCEVIYLENEKCKTILLNTFHQLRNKF
jgi:tRNA(adenine34) deaminase